MGNVELNIPHYSLVTRSEVLRRRFVEHRTWESAAPSLKVRIASPILPPSAAGAAAWIRRAPHFRLCGALLKRWSNGWTAASSLFTAHCAWLGLPYFLFCESSGLGPCASERDIFPHPPSWPGNGGPRFIP